MKKIIIFSVLLLAAGCVAKSQENTIPSSPAYNYTHQLKIGNKILNVEVANTPAAQAQGLSDRSSMANNQGMLFEFGSAASLSPAFWMKDMDFNLDFIWIDQNKIIGITPNVPRPVNCQSLNVNCLPLYYPPSPVNQVLEVNAGWTAENNIKVGDQTKILN